jgi:hypothetical protein
VYLALGLKHVEHFEDDDDNDNDTDDVEDISAHGSWIEHCYPVGEQYFVDSRAICSQLELERPCGGAAGESTFFARGHHNMLYVRRYEFLSANRKDLIDRCR